MTGDERYKLAGFLVPNLKGKTKTKSETPDCHNFNASPTLFVSRLQMEYTGLQAE